MTLIRLKPALVISGWGTSLAAVTLGAIFHGQLLPMGIGGQLPEVIDTGLWGRGIIYLEIFGISFLAALILKDPGTALASFFASYALGAGVTFLVLALPGFLGEYPPGVLVQLSVLFTFTAFFPFPLLIGLLGTVLGFGLAEHLY